ncbi:hypothetical protein Tco_1360280 [Tanacetum coccineum]
MSSYKPPRCSYSGDPFDSLLEEFFGELAHIDLIPPRINEGDFDPEEDIRLVERLLYDNSSPSTAEKNLIQKIMIAIIEPSLHSYPHSCTGIENDDYDSEGDIIFLEKLLSNDSPSLPENESFHFDVPSSPRPPAKPPDDGIYFEPDTGVLQNWWMIFLIIR